VIDRLAGGSWWKRDEGMMDGEIGIFVGELKSGWGTQKVVTVIVQ